MRFTKLVKLGLLLGGASMALGCSSIVVAAYEEPAGPDRAPITFRNSGGVGVNVSFYEGAERCTGRRGRIKPESGDVHTFIDTRKETAFTVYQAIVSQGPAGLVRSVWCQASISMKADPRRKYLVTLTPVDNKRCVPQVTETDADGSFDHGKPAAVKYHEDIRAVMSEAGPWCKPAA